MKTNPVKIYILTFLYILFSPINHKIQAQDICFDELMPIAVADKWATSATTMIQNCTLSDTYQTQIISTSLQRLKTRAIAQIISWPQPEQIPNAINTLLLNVSKIWPAALDTSDFAIALTDTNGITTNLVSYTTQTQLANVRQDLSLCQIANTTTDNDATAIIKKRGTIRALTEKMAKNPTWTNSANETLKSRVANHLDYLAVISSKTNDIYRKYLLELRPTDPWVVIMSYITATDNKFRNSLTNIMTKIGISTGQIINLENMSVNIPQISKIATQMSQTSCNELMNQYNGDDDDDTRNEIAANINELQISQTNFLPQLNTINSNSANTTTNISSQNQKRAQEQIISAWHNRSANYNGDSITPTQIEAYRHNPQLREIIIYQGDITAQNTLISQSKKDNDITTHDIKLLCNCARDNQSLRNLVTWTNLPTQNRIDIIHAIRRDNTETDTLLSLFSQTPINADEMATLIREQSPPYVARTAFKSQQTSEVAQEAVKGTDSELTLTALKLFPYDPAVFLNAMTQAPILMILHDANACAARDILVKNTNYSAAYTNFNLNQIQTLLSSSQAASDSIKKIDADTIINQMGTFIANANIDISTTQTIDFKFWPVPPDYKQSASDKLASSVESEANLLNQAESNTSTNTTNAKEQQAKANNQLATTGNQQQILIYSNMPDGTTKSIMVTVTNAVKDTITKSLDSIQNNWNAQTTAQGLTTNSDVSITPSIQNAINNAKITADALKANQIINNQAKTWTNGQGLTSGSLDNKSFSDLLTLLEDTKIRAAQEKAAWLDRSDLSGITATHPYWAKLPPDTKTPYQFLLKTTSTGDIKRNIVDNGTIISEYNSDNTSNPNYIKIKNTIYYTIVYDINGNRTDYVDYYQYLQDCWKKRYFDISSPTSIANLESKIKNAESTVSIQELQQLASKLNAMATLEQKQINDLNPSIIPTTSPKFNTLLPEMKNPPYLQTSYNGNTKKSFVNLKYYYQEQWNSKYAGQGTGSLTYLNNLIKNRTSKN